MQSTVRGMPITQVPRMLSASQAHSYRDDYYERMHVIPTKLAMGNVVTEQQRTVALWNAYTGTTRTLASVSAVGADGIDITAPQALPYAFRPLRYELWTISVTPNGPPVVDAAISWNFDSALTLTVPVTGNRITAWTLPPDWARPVTERLEWLTDVMVSVNRTEQARALRQCPRRTWDFECLAQGAERQWAEASLYEWSGRTWAVPVWTDGQVLASAVNQSDTVPCSTVNRDFAVGQLVMFYASALSYELAEVSGVAADGLTLARAATGSWPVGTRLFPVRTAQLTGTPAVSRKTDRMMRVSPTFLNTDSTWTADAGPSVYRCLPVLEQQPEWSQDPTGSYERAVTTADNQTAAPVFTEYADIGFPSGSHRFWLRGAAARASWRSLMYYLRGRYKLAWVPSYQDDLIWQQPVTSGASTIEVDWCGYTRLLAGRQHRRDIRIELLDGTVLYRRIIGWAEVSATTERLTLDSVLGQAIDPAQIRQTSYMTVARLASDAVEIAHDNGLHETEGVAVSVATFKAVNDDI